jgi:hypothetical protein
VGLLVRHPAPAAVVLAALAVTAVVFVFFRPEYHPKGENSFVKVDWSDYPPASDDWTWSAGQPGFRFGEHEDEWNFSGMEPADLAAARTAARRWGVSSASVRLLYAIRLGPHDLNMVVAGTNAADRTCLGFVMQDEPVEYRCGERLDSEAVLLLLTRAGPSNANGMTYEPASVAGIERADVTRIVVDQPPDWNDVSVFDRPSGHSYWGAWELSLGPSPDAIVTAYLSDGSVRRAAVDLARPGDRIIPIPG